LSEWQEYYSIEPFGEERADLRAGIIAATVENWSHRKSGKAATPGDYMPLRQTEKPTPAQLRQKLLLWARGMGADVNPGPSPCPPPAISS
jgi:hypothetical protein